MPSLQAPKSFYTPSYGERSLERISVCTEDNAVNVQRTWSDIYLASNAPVRTGRTWGSKKAAKAPVEAVPELKTQPPTSISQEYGKDQFLLMRQCMMDAGQFEKPARGNRLMCMEAPSTEASPSVGRSQKLSTESLCSTIDTLSDTSEEPDAASSSSADLVSIGAPPGLQGMLRVNAPEFVPSTLWCPEEPPCASFPETLLDPMPPAQASDVAVLGTTPLVNITEMPGGLRWEQDSCASKKVFGTTPLVNITEIPGGLRWEDDAWQSHSVALSGVDVDLCQASVEHPGMYTVAELLQEADRRTQEWRQYCGLAPIKFDDFPPQGCSF